MIRTKTIAPVAARAAKTGRTKATRTRSLPPLRQS